MSEIKNKLESILLQHLKFVKESKITDWNTDLKSLGLDSISSINILMSIEDELNVSFPDEYLTESTFKSANSLYNAFLTISNPGK